MNSQQNYHIKIRSLWQHLLIAVSFLHVVISRVSCFLPSFISHLCNSKASSRMRDTEQEEQGVETYHSDKSDKVDMMMNPKKFEKYQISVERTKQDIRWRWSLSLTVRDSITSYFCRSIYDKIDLDKSYDYLFELLWYSQIPCFDILNITTKIDQEHGEKI